MAADGEIPGRKPRARRREQHRVWPAVPRSDPGRRPIPARTDRVRVHYTGKLIDGTVFDSSVARGEPAEFPVTGVIGGWIEALTLMPVGSKWELTIPQPGLRRARRGASIPPFSTLIF